MNKRHEAFCLEYIKDRNATAAYKRAGYAPKRDNTAKSAASRLLTNVDSGVPARIEELEAELAARTWFEIEDVVRAHVAIIRADPAALCKPVRGACRYCHGFHHEYQWRTQREFDVEVLKWKVLSPQARRLNLEPNKAGGFAYDSTRKPHPTCPECDGLGQLHVHFAAYEDIPVESRPLYRGVERTANGGIKLQMADINASLDQLARHLGFYSKQKHLVHDTADPLTDLIKSIQSSGSKMPITSKLRVKSGSSE